MVSDRLCAEDLPYWRTSQSAPDVWIERTQAVIEKLGGRVTAEAFGRDADTGRSAFMLQFEAEGDVFRISWPVMATRDGHDAAARRQAATMLYHDAKAKSVASAVFGIRATFLQHLLLSNGRTASQVSAPELLQALPYMMRAQLTDGEPTDGK
jgi:hypothetical protein